MKIEELANMFVENDSIAWETVDKGVRRKIMAYDERLMLVKVDFETGAIGTLHNHFHTQITHIHSGVFEVEIDGNKQVLKANDVFFVPTDLVHGVVCLEAGVLIDVFSPVREDFIK